MTVTIGRRELLAALGGAAAAWPIAARAQQAAMPVVGLLSPLAAGSSEHLLHAFRRGLAESGRIEGQNVAIDYRLAGGFDQFPELAADLARRQVSVIAASGSVTAVAAKAATQTIPIAFIAAEDPVKLGLVASLARPAGNATGLNFFTAEVNAKRLGLLRELLPAAKQVAILINPTNPINMTSTLAEVEQAARDLALQIQIVNARTRWILHQSTRPTGCAGSPPCDSHIVFGAGACRSRRVDELWREPHRCLSSARRRHRPHPQGH
jgi:putative ABC transport system substrate-binding protein